jgi:LysR family transcriptional regulator, hydrogen peroxide-inducible genes activator
MTLQELRYIVALADTGHFGQAAEACFVSQSTLSTQVKKLEDLLGVQLFDRTLKRVVPTPAGEEVIDSARRVLEEVSRIRDIARQSCDPMERTVQLGVIPTLGPYYLPHILNLVHGQYPKLRLLLREEMTPFLLQSLLEGRLDAGLLALPVDNPALEVVPLFVEPFLAALPSGHALAREDEIRVDDLATQGLLLLEEGHCLRDQALEACHLEGLGNEEIRATSLETLRQMVGMGLGVTLLPVMAGSGLHAASNLIQLRPLAAPGAARTIGLVWRKRSPLANTMALLARDLKACLPSGTLPVS